MREAEALMLRPDDGSSCAFELAEDGWLVVLDAAWSQRPPSRSESGARVADLQSQLTLMRGLHAALLERVIAIEALLHVNPPQSMPPQERQVAVRPGVRVPSRRDMLAVLRQPSQKAPPPLSLLSVQSAEDAEATESESAAPVAESTRLEPTTAVRPAAPRLALPAPADVIRCLHMLAGDEPVTPGPTSIPDDVRTLYVAALVDGSGEALGAMLFNQRACAALGGSLLGLPPAARDEQTKSGIAKDTLDGLNEVCNNLSGLINRRNPKDPTKLVPLARATSVDLPWLSQPAATLGFALPADGRLWFVSR